MSDTRYIERHFPHFPSSITLLISETKPILANEISIAYENENLSGFLSFPVLPTQNPAWMPKGVRMGAKIMPDFLGRC